MVPAPEYGLGMLQVPPAGLPCRAIEDPIHPLTSPAETMGNAFTDTVTEFKPLPEQPALEPETEYVVVDDGETKMLVVVSPVDHR